MLFLGNDKLGLRTVGGVCAELIRFCFVLGDDCLRLFGC